MATLHYETSEDNLHKRYLAVYLADASAYVSALHPCTPGGMSHRFLCLASYMLIALLLVHWGGEDKEKEMIPSDWGKNKVLPLFLWI